MSAAETSAVVQGAGRDRAEASMLARHWPVALFGIALVALFLRWLPLADAYFPLKDGGLFALMAEELKTAGYRLPEFTTYNGADIPFAYPPLGIYLAALLSELPGIEVLDALRLVPLAATTATVVAMFPLSRRLLRSTEHALLAMLILALLPRAFQSDLMGGGVTRAPGFFFAIGALVLVWDVYHRGSRVRLALASLCASAAVLSHLEAGLFVALTAALFLAAHRERLRANLASSATGALLTALLTAPWWATVIEAHGVAPFVAAATGGSHWTPWVAAQLAGFRLTGTPMLDVFAVMAVVGGAWSIRQRDWLLPAWLLTVFVLDPRRAITFGMAPLAMLAARGLADVVLPALCAPAVEAGRAVAPHLAQRAAAPALLGLVLFTGFIGAVGAGDVALEPVPSQLHPLFDSDRAAMAWVSEHAPEDSRFLVLSDAEEWHEVRTEEWFPVLAGRVSVSTPQGLEWLPDGALAAAIERYQRLVDCRGAGADCLLDWSRASGLRFSHLYLAPDAVGGPCCPHLEAELEDRADFRLLHVEGPVRVYEYLPPAESP